MNTIKPLALYAFRREPESLNCAQTILAAYQSATGETIATIPSFKPFGGGRAPDNECGALYAACQCLPEHAPEIRAAFLAELGSHRCKVLKRELRVACETCVGMAADLVSAKLNA